MPDRRTAEHSEYTPEQRAARARQAALARWAKDDRHAGTQAARTAFMDRFERQVDPDGELPPRERAERAERAKRAYFQGLANKRHGRKRTS